MINEFLKITPTCVNCDQCIFVCPENAITGFENEYYIDHWSCSLCEICINLCPTNALLIDKRSI